MVALPPQLFRSVGIPVCLWFFAKDKKKGRNGSVDRTGEVLFVDARNLGYMVDRAERSFIDADISQIADTFHAWRGTDPSLAAGVAYRDQPGFCHSVSVTDIKAADYALTPGRYVGSVEVAANSEPLEHTVERLNQELLGQFEESDRLASVVRMQLERVK